MTAPTDARHPTGADDAPPPPAEHGAAGGVPCCPELTVDRPCDVVDFHYRLIHSAEVVGGDNQERRRVPVEVLLHMRLERCPGPLALGDLVYSTTLFPGERVRLFSADRRSRFTFDSSTSVSYRHEQTSEERYFMSSMSDFMSDITVRDESRASSAQRGSVDTHAGTSGALETFFGGASVDVSGSYDAESTRDFLREITRHAEASHNRAVEATRTASSVSVGEVQTRAHAEGETEDHFESASRSFANPNRCHAVTFFFYQINKTQTVRLTLEAIERRVLDPAADTRVANNPFASRGEVAVIPNAVLATAKDRLEVEQIGRASVAAQAAAPAVGTGAGLAPVAALRLASAGFAVAQPAEPLAAEVRAKALAAVDADLAKAGLLDRKTGGISGEAGARFGFEVTSSLPTPGLFVRGCLDECGVCEPELHREIELDLERRALENELLRRRIELLDRAQEYRCCPGGGEAEPAATA